MTSKSELARTFTANDYMSKVYIEPNGYSVVYTNPAGVVRKEFYLYEDVAVASASRWVNSGQPK